MAILGVPIIFLSTRELKLKAGFDDIYGFGDISYFGLLGQI